MLGTKIRRDMQSVNGKKESAVWNWEGVCVEIFGACKQNWMN